MAADHDDYCVKEYSYTFLPDILKDQAAFITGGGSGIGMRIAEILMRSKPPTSITDDEYIPTGMAVIL